MAGGQAVSDGMRLMRGGWSGERRSRCAPVVGRGRRRWPETLMGLAESHIGALSPLRKWRRGYGDKEAPCGSTFEKEVEADT